MSETRFLLNLDEEVLVISYSLPGRRIVVMDVNNYPCEYIAYTLLGISNRSDDFIGLVYFLHKVKEKNGQS